MHRIGEIDLSFEVVHAPRIEWETIMISKLLNIRISYLVLFYLSLMVYVTLVLFPMSIILYITNTQFYDFTIAMFNMIISNPWSIMLQ